MGAGSWMKWRKSLNKTRDFDQISISQTRSQAKVVIVIKGDVDITGPKVKEVYELLIKGSRLVGVLD